MLVVFGFVHARIIILKLLGGSVSICTCLCQETQLAELGPDGHDGERVRVSRVIVPKGAGVPITQTKVNIFDKEVCKNLQWDQDGEKEPNKGEEPNNGQVPILGGVEPDGATGPAHKDGYMSEPPASVSGQAGGPQLPPEQVQAQLAAARTVLSQYSHDFECWNAV